MDAMTMTYRVDPRSLMAGVRIGDKISFEIDAGRYAIIAIGIAPPGKRGAGLTGP